jgi:predicted nucleic acid-binding protein
VNLVDSSAWLEYFAGGPQAQRFAAAIEDGPNLLVPTIVLLEVTRRVMQQRGEDDALQVAAVLHQGQVVPLDSGIALNAAQLGVAHKLPLANSIIFATAKQFGATVWTMDADFSGLTDVRYFPKRKQS